MFEKLKQIKDYRSQAKKIQSALKEESVEGSGAWGKVKISMDGNQNVDEVKIDPEMLSPNRQNDLQKAVQEAVNDAIKKAQHKMAKKVKDMGGLPNLG
ncbi:MAG: nucleoid-associated protein, YbaB/EbfC family [Candidatus Kerfeldbacteria bacterium CG08_land_8_20_14_0_20_43_14]|uniref:Nucleoid-associated protein, YbaB/EbfC family n=1 Tax=Candidatus Kerfeldbacteria bacterium CG08_land_8_20_14_0_20_43_14 TaxID=2014246 RepID=A0A2H0YRU7_9BACT|nr:MAG: nucleoid-associated protein, YbaB/EbfC family [Candidatus Kerfeldbacteria bacterium CG08_land_8_20_14_0_20_43_14]